MVKLVMGALQTELEADMDNVLPLAPAAIAVVAALKSEGQQFLIADGRVDFISHLVRNHADQSRRGANAWNVYVPRVEENPACDWCDRPYGSAECGAPHGLCKNCYQYGPSD